MNRYISLVFFLLAVLAATAVGASFEAGAWYQDLNKPDWTPPDWFFGPAWAVIYLLMAVAAWRVWLSGKSMRVGALAWWLLILAFNVAWSWFMFGLNRTGWAFALSVIVLGISIMCCRAFMLLSRSAGLMMLPLAGWLLFVVYLNYAIWAMNRGGFGQLFG
jgi:tryptophan-rich sensory protein